MKDLDMRYFEELRALINQHLEDLQTPHRHLQINQYPWLYGAIGAVPSDVMFICENPSIAGVRQAHVDTIDGLAPDIEAQWWGGAAKRFRKVLSKTGLKTNRPDERGGWNCYITNVVKEANNTGLDQRSKSSYEKQEQARSWSDILRWELENVQPKYVYCVGVASYKMVNRLQSEQLLPRFRPILMYHYSARRREQDILEKMQLPIREMIGGAF